MWNSDYGNRINPNSIFNYMVDSSLMSIMHLLYFLFDIR